MLVFKMTCDRKPMYCSAPTIAELNRGLGFTLVLVNKIDGEGNYTLKVFGLAGLTCMTFSQPFILL